MPYSELEIQRQHLIEQKTPADRAMVMVGINRLLDEMLDGGPIDIEASLPPSAEGQAHIDNRADNLERGCE